MGETSQKFQNILQNKLNEIKFCITTKKGEGYQRLIEDCLSLFDSTSELAKKMEFLFQVITSLWNYEMINEILYLLPKIEIQLEILQDNPTPEKKHLISTFFFISGCIEAYKGKYPETITYFNLAVKYATELRLKALILVNLGGRFGSNHEMPSINHLYSFTHVIHSNGRFYFV